MHNMWVPQTVPHDLIHVLLQRHDMIHATLQQLMLAHGRLHSGTRMIHEV